MRARICAVCAILMLAAGPSLVGGIATAAASSESGADTIPPGTKVTQANWQQYQRFMTDGMKMLFAGNNFWHSRKAGRSISDPRGRSRYRRSS